MSVLQLLSTVKGHKDNQANIALAKETASTENSDAVRELVQNLNHKDKKIQADCIKVLYETGYIKPELIAPYVQEFLSLLSGKNNRMIWGSMIALTTIVNLKHQEIYQSLDIIMQAVDKGSVITVDGGVIILASLNRHTAYADTTYPLLMEQLLKCPVKQLPMYAERSMESINERHRGEFMNIIENRLQECEKDSQKKRLLNILKMMNE
jgi:hypothetical protein